MSHRLRFPSDVRTNAPLRVPTSTRTPLIPSSFLSFRRRSPASLSPEHLSPPGVRRAEARNDAQSGLPLALASPQDLFAQAEGVGCGLHELVLADELEGLLEAEQPRRGKVRRLVGGGRAHIRELFLLGDVHL